MLNKSKQHRDAFSFSLGGMKTIASFVPLPVIADDRIRKSQDKRLKQDKKAPDKKVQIWRLGRAS